MDISKELIEENKKSKELSHVNFFTGDCTNLSFLMFIKRLCKEKGWRYRIFRFLDSITLKGTQFNTMLDARYLKPPENAILKLLEFPIRKTAHMQRLQEGSCHIYALGYGLEIFFDNEHASHIENVFYFDEEVELDKLSILSELNDSIRYWDLSFEKL